MQHILQQYTQNIQFIQSYTTNQIVELHYIFQFQPCIIYKIVLNPFHDHHIKLSLSTAENKINYSKQLPIQSFKMIQIQPNIPQISNKLKITFSNNLSLPQKIFKEFSLYTLQTVRTKIKKQLSNIVESTNYPKVKKTSKKQSDKIDQQIQDNQIQQVDQDDECDQGNQGNIDDKKVIKKMNKKELKKNKQQIKQKDKNLQNLQNNSRDQQGNIIQQFKLHQKEKNKIQKPEQQKNYQDLISKLRKKKDFNQFLNDLTIDYRKQCQTYQNQIKSDYKFSNYIPNTTQSFTLSTNLLITISIMQQKQYLFKLLRKKSIIQIFSTLDSQRYKTFQEQFFAYIQLNDPYQTYFYKIAARKQGFTVLDHFQQILYIDTLCLFVEPEKNKEYRKTLGKINGLKLLFLTKYSILQLSKGACISIKDLIQAQLAKQS